MNRAALKTVYFYVYHIDLWVFHMIRPEECTETV